ncbi:hypothetical protein CGLO_14847 [Colletotrichum gloeosporioides Cg-14]
MLWCY